VSVPIPCGCSRQFFSVFTRFASFFPCIHGWFIFFRSIGSFESYLVSFDAAFSIGFHLSAPFSVVKVYGDLPGPLGTGIPSNFLQFRPFEQVHCCFPPPCRGIFPLSGDFPVSGDLTFPCFLEVFTRSPPLWPSFVVSRGAVHLDAHAFPLPSTPPLPVCFLLGPVP